MRENARATLTLESRSGVFSMCQRGKKSDSKGTLRVDPYARSTARRVNSLLNIRGVRRLYAITL